jgi:hypothetical protein
VALAILSVLLLILFYIWLAQFLIPGELQSTWVRQAAAAPLVGLGVTCLGAVLRSWVETIVGVVVMWAPVVFIGMVLVFWRIDSLI